MEDFMEKKYGLNDEDVDSFLERVDNISSQIQAIKDGKFDDAKETPREAGIVYSQDEDAKTAETKSISATKKWFERQDEESTETFVTRIKHEEEKQKNEKKGFERRRQEALEKLEREKAEGERKKREEERSLWWEHAEMFFSKVDTPSEDEIKEIDRIQAAKKWRHSHDANDYSRWDGWLQDLDDPIAREQKRKIEEKRQKSELDDFEKRNVEWCSRMREDMGKRRSETERKEKRCERLRKEGNEHFKKKRYKRALLFYHEGLKLCPFDTAVLTNIAQCHWKARNIEQTAEFASRAIFIDPKHVKARTRRAVAYREQGKYEEAANDLKCALFEAPNNASVRKQYDRALFDMKRASEDRSIDDRDDMCTNEAMETSSTLTKTQTNDKTIDTFVDAVATLRKRMQDEGSISDVDFLEKASRALDLIRKSRRQRIRVRSRKGGAIEGLSVIARALVVKNDESTKRDDDRDSCLCEILRIFDAMCANKVNSEAIRRDGKALRVALRVVQDQEGRFIRDGAPAANQVAASAVTFLQTITFSDPASRVVVLNIVAASKRSSAQFSSGAASLLCAKSAVVMKSAIGLVRNLGVVRDSKLVSRALETSVEAIVTGLVAAISRRRRNGEAIEDVLAAIANLAMHSFARESFLATSAISGDLPCAVTTLMDISQLSSGDATSRSIALGALANASIDNPEICAKIFAFEKGCAVRCFLRVIRESRKLESEELANELCSRAALLLSRCVKCHVVARERICKEESTFDDLVRSFVTKDRLAKFVRSKLVSVVATCLKRSPRLALRLRSLGGVRSILEMLPSSAAETKCADPIAYGNATQCIISCADVASSSGDLTLKHLGESDAVSRLVEILKSSEHAAARKNAAVALAKLARDAGLKSRIRELRGFEILMSIASPS